MLQGILPRAAPLEDRSEVQVYPRIIGEKTSRGAVMLQRLRRLPLPLEENGEIDVSRDEIRLDADHLAQVKSTASSVRPRRSRSAASATRGFA